MKLKHYSSEKLKKELLEIASKYFDMESTELFFFGSRVTERSTDRSDIDIGIRTKTEDNSAVYNFAQDVEESIPVLYKFDIVDTRDMADEFKEIALEKIEYINKLDD